MGIYDRDYYRESTRKWWSNWGDRRVTLWLIGITVGAFILQLVSRSQEGRDELAHWGAFYYPAILDGQVWRLLSAHFLHDSHGFFHIAFNMLLLYFVGSELEATYGPAEFLAFYLATALIVSLGKVVVALVGLVPPPYVAALGASGPVTAAFILYACHYPYRRILIMFILPVPAWLAAVGVVLLDLMGVLGAGQPNVGYTAHLLGAAFAYAYYRFSLRVLNLVPRLGRVRTVRRKPTLRVFEEPREERQPVGASTASLSRPSVEGSSSRSVDEQLEAKLDNVLEKVARYGRESLTAEEQQILMRASEIYKRRRGG